VIVVFATAVDAKGAFEKIAGLAIGLTIVFGILMSGPLTGGALNPARAFGPELVSGYWTNAWVYYVGPLAGGALAAILYEVLYLSHRESGEEAPAEIEPEPEPEPAGGTGN
jgi:aquaporin Z